MVPNIEAGLSASSGASSGLKKGDSYRISGVNKTPVWVWFALAGAALFIFWKMRK